MNEKPPPYTDREIEILAELQETHDLAVEHMHEIFAQEHQHEEQRLDAARAAQGKKLKQILKELKARQRVELIELATVQNTDRHELISNHKMGD